MPTDSAAENGPAVKEQRYVGLDALRGFMMMLGIVLHASLLYLQAPPLSQPAWLATQALFHPPSPAWS